MKNNSIMWKLRYYGRKYNKGLEVINGMKKLHMRLVTTDEWVCITYRSHRADFSSFY